MADPTTCPKCGKPKQPQHKLCYSCFKESQRNRGNGGGRGRGGSATLPEECVFKESFYGDNDHLRREIFMEAAQEAASTFERDRMSASSIRSLFQMLKDMDQRAKSDPDLPLGEVQERYYHFVRQCVYQQKRDIIKDAFLQFAERHTDVATKSKEEFHGFVEYLTSIMARMKTK